MLSSVTKNSINGSESKTRVLVIGLDGATFDLIMPWIEHNKLPTIKKMMNVGTFSTLESTIPPITPVAWKSFMTGKNPGSHGTFDFYGIKPGTYERGLAMRFQRKSKTLWSILSQYGKKCCIFNVPHTYPPEKINGYLVSGFLSPGLESEFTYPKEFKKELLKEIPDYRIHGSPYSDTEAGKERFLKEIFQVTDIHARAAEFVINKLDWDFSMVYFKQTDSIAHYFWKYLDETHPLYDRNGAMKYGNKILELYQKLDRIISSICKNLHEDTNIMIMSDHGFGPHYGNFYVNNWLIKNGYMTIKNTPGSLYRSLLASVGFTPASVVRILLNLGINMGKLKFDRTISFEKKKRLLNKIFLSLNDIDWSRTKAFSMGTYAPMYINLKNKFPNGMIDDGPSYDRLRLEIKEKLLKLTLPNRNNRLIDDIYMKEDLYEGRYVDEAPDIIFSMKNYSYSSSALFDFGSNRTFSNAVTHKSGDHGLYGILIMNGHNIKTNNTLNGAKITDLFPTILHLMKCPIPNDIDGRVLSDSFIE